MSYNSLSLRQFREYFSSLAIPKPYSVRGQSAQKVSAELAEQSGWSKKEVYARVNQSKLPNQIHLENNSTQRLIGLGNSGVSNIAEEHDEYLVQEIEKEGK